MAWVVVLLIVAAIAVGPLAAKEIVERPSYDDNVDDLSINNNELLEPDILGVTLNPTDFTNSQTMEDYPDWFQQDPSIVQDPIEYAGLFEGDIIINRPAVSKPRGCKEIDGFYPLIGTQKCFKLFIGVDSDWYLANLICYKNKATIVKTSDVNAVEIRKSLLETFGEDGRYAWLNARFNGVQYQWSDGELISNDNKLWFPGHPIHKPDYCLVLLNDKGFMNQQPSKPYWTCPCTLTAWRKTFCEVDMSSPSV